MRNLHHIIFTWSRIYWQIFKSALMYFWGCLWNKVMPIKLIPCVKSVQIRGFFWSVFFHIWTEYGKIRSISPYSVRMRENMDQKKTTYLDTFHAVIILQRKFHGDNHPMKFLTMSLPRLIYIVLSKLTLFVFSHYKNSKSY